jgi:hypothetical protein
MEIGGWRGGRVLAGEVGAVEMPVRAVYGGVLSEHGGVEEGRMMRKGCIVDRVVGGGRVGGGRGGRGRDGNGSDATKDPSRSRGLRTRLSNF